MSPTLTFQLAGAVLCAPVGFLVARALYRRGSYHTLITAVGAVALFGLIRYLGIDARDPAHIWPMGGGFALGAVGAMILTERENQMAARAGQNSPDE